MKPFLNIFLCLSLLVFSACTSDSGDDNDSSDPGNIDDSLSTNACSYIGLSTRIINGTECTENNSPVVELQLKLADGREGTCTGDMLTSRHVLTAAHCFFEGPTSVRIKAAGVDVGASTVITHPDVQINNQAVAVENDVAVVLLDSPVSLPTLPLIISRAAVKGEEIKIFGYGISEDQSSSNNTAGVLRSGEMKISEVNSKFIDAYYSGKGSNTCSGDSGGPALSQIGTTVGIFGILSSGNILACTEGDTSKFTSIQNQSVLDFISRYVPGVRLI